jgi:excisionase family DNA binding protein
MLAAEPATPAQYLTNREAAELARVSTKTIRAWARSGRLRAYGSARKPLYRRADLCALVESREAPSDPRR